jgi:hypothetical protein
MNFAMFVVTGLLVTFVSCQTTSPRATKKKATTSSTLSEPVTEDSTSGALTDPSGTKSTQSDTPEPTPTESAINSAKEPIAKGDDKQPALSKTEEDYGLDIKSHLTLMTCLEDEGNPWMGVGLVVDDRKTIMALIVSNDVDKATKTLMKTYSVKHKKLDGGFETTDELGLFHLVVKPEPGADSFKGKLTLKEPANEAGVSPPPVEKTLSCFKESTIEYDQQ